MTFKSIWLTDCLSKEWNAELLLDNITFLTQQYYYMMLPKGYLRRRRIKKKKIAEVLNLAPDRITWRLQRDSFSYEEEFLIRELITELRTNNKITND